ncbi:hypothetical protein Sjap_011124 [Stephania japonica]|uniref:Uncharacterized protein n=1 Tax=Stephania japonica TaxID=461633 RepID=A0AAP0JCW6_9MAGN
MKPSFVIAKKKDAKDGASAFASTIAAEGTAAAGTQPEAPALAQPSRKRMTASHKKKINENPSPKRRQVKDKDVNVEGPVHTKGSRTPSIDYAHNSNAAEDSAACPSTIVRSTGDAGSRIFKVH